MSLGDIQGEKRPPSKNVCKRHRWREAKFSRTCTVRECTEDKTAVKEAVK